MTKEEARVLDANLELNKRAREEMERAMGSRPDPLQPIFRDHNCGGCDSGRLPCQEKNYNNCSWPRARND